MCAIMNNIHGSLMDYLISVGPHYLVIIPFMDHVQKLVFET